MVLFILCISIRLQDSKQQGEVQAAYISAFYKYSWPWQTQVKNLQNAKRSDFDATHSHQKSLNYLLT